MSEHTREDCGVPTEQVNPTPAVICDLCSECTIKANCKDKDDPLIKEFEYCSKRKPRQSYKFTPKAVKK